MTRDTPMRVAVTGGPGAGKTSLLEALRTRGYPVVPEVAREIISERKARGLSPRPTADQFARLIMDRDIRQHESAPASEKPIFFDRSLLDSMGMLAQLRLLEEGDKRRLLARYPYHATAFILPPWREIYRMDAERDQTFAEAVFVYESMKEWYVGCGYRVMEVPTGSIDERCRFVLRGLGERKPCG